tara:strand:- start:707 stop:1519 length:813 start_codon:yes stop_codon:yes gene_type:complete
MPIGLGVQLGLGGGRASTSSGASGGVALTDELAYPNGLWTASNYTITVQPVYHFDASILDGAAAGNNPSNGTAVATWGNRSGQSTDYDAIQSTASAQPVFQGNYVDFIPNDYMSVNNPPGLTGGEAFTLITVAYKDGTGVFAPVGKHPLINSYYLPLNYSNGVTYFLSGSGSVSTAGYGPHFNSIQQFVVTKDTSNDVEYFLQGNNSYKTLSYGFTLSGLFGTIGHNGYNHDGRIYEILLFDSQLSAANLNVIRTYLNNKYTDLPASTAF